MKYFSLVILSILICSCNRTEVDDKLGLDCMEEITYTADVKAILDNSCAYAGCHLGSAPGDFSSYATMESYLDNGELRKRSLQVMDMPPNYAPDNKPKSLSTEEIDILNCWVEGDYKE